MKINYKYAIIVLIAWFSPIIPIFIFIFFTNNVQKILSGIKDINFIYGITNPLSGLTMIFGLIFFGAALGLTIYLYFRIFRPGYKEYEKKLDSVSKFPETVTIGFNPPIEVPTRWFTIPEKYEKILLCISSTVVIFSGIVIYSTLYDYTAVNEQNIYTRYYFKQKSYTWQNINSAELEFKYYKPRQNDSNPKWSYMINLILLKGDEKIYIWRDNGLSKPSKEEIIWLLNKLKQENIVINSSSVSINVLQGLYQTNNDFKNRIYPAIDSLIISTKD